MKKFFALVLALAFVTPVFAQKGGSHGSSSHGSSSHSSSSSHGSSHSSAPSHSAAPSHGSSYSSGSKSFSSSPSAASKPSAAPTSKPSAHTYSSGSSNFSKPNSLAPSGPSKSSLDSGASKATKVAQSTAAYNASKPASAPAQEKAAKVAASASKPRVDRERVIYRSAPTTVIYRDTFHPGLDTYLMSQSANTLATFLYMHRAEMDEARYRDLLARNADARIRLAELEAKHVAVDPTYTPPGVDFDLLYQEPSRSSFGNFLKFLTWSVIFVVIAFAALAGVAYLVRNK